MHGNQVRFLAATVLLLWPVRGQSLNDFFDDSVLHEVRVQISPVDWQALRDNYLENTYYRCEFTWRDLHLTDVGVRSRGSGTRNPIKPNLGFDFSRYKSSQRFLSLKSLVTRNFAQDPSMVREFLTMKLFARMGLSHLRESHAKLFVNGEYAGLYLMVEPIDKRFLLSRFGEDTGYLYEGKFAGTPYHFEYLGENAQAYMPDLFEPKTHEDDPDAAHLIAMIRTANQAADGEFLAAMERFIDVDQFVAHLAVEQFLAENDGLLGYGGMTNYYLYRRMSDNRYVLLPWDKDNTFALTDRPIWQNASSNVLFRRLLSHATLRQRFLQTVKHAEETAGGAFGWLYAENERVYWLIRDAALADTLRVCVLPDGIGRCEGPEFEIQHSFLEAFPAARTEFTGREVSESGLETNPRAPALRAGSVTNLASGRSVVSPGSLARITMSSLLDRTMWAGTVPLPRELQGLRVRVAGVDAPVWMVGPWEVYFQVPWETLCGVQTVHVTWEGAQDHVIDVEVRPAEVGIFAVSHTDWTAVSPAKPARSGEWVVFWGTGFAWTNVEQKTGEPSPAAGLLPTAQKVTATVDGVPATVRFAGMAPGWIGTVQVVIEMPAMAARRSAPVLITVNDEPGVPFWLEVTP